MKTSYPVEVRRSPWAVWSWLGWAAACVGGAVAIWFQAPALVATTAPIALLAGMLGCVLVFVWLRAERWVLHPDRVERIGLRGVRAMRRDDVLGYRQFEDEVWLFDRANTRRLSIPGHVFRNPAWRVWINTCRNLHAEEVNAALDEAERDPALGDSVESRQRTLVQRRRMVRTIAWAMILLALWTIFWPRPFFLPILLCCAALPVAIALLALKPGLFRLFPKDEVGTRVDLSMTILGPAAALVVLSMRIPMADWREPLLIALPIAAGVTALAMMFGVDARERNWVMGGLIGGFIFANVWGGAVMLNRILDRQPPAVLPATVTATGGSSTKPAVDVALGGSRPIRLRDIDVSRATLAAQRAGQPICGYVFPGRFGWRSVRVAACAPIVPIVPVAPVEPVEPRP